MDSCLVYGINPKNHGKTALLFCRELEKIVKDVNAFAESISRCISIIISYTVARTSCIGDFTTCSVTFISPFDEIRGFYALLETPWDAIFERNFMACRAALKLYKSFKSRTIKINKSNFLNGILCTRRVARVQKCLLFPHNVIINEIFRSVEDRNCINGLNYTR